MTKKLSKRDQDLKQELLEQACERLGIEVPSTLEGLLEVIKKLDQARGVPLPSLRVLVRAIGIKRSGKS